MGAPRVRGQHERQHRASRPGAQVRLCSDSSASPSAGQRDARAGRQVRSELGGRGRQVVAQRAFHDGAKAGSLHFAQALRGRLRARRRPAARRTRDSRPARGAARRVENTEPSGREAPRCRSAPRPCRRAPPGCGSRSCDDLRPMDRARRSMAAAARLRHPSRPDERRERVFAGLRIAALPSSDSARANSDAKPWAGGPQTPGAAAAEPARGRGGVEAKRALAQQPPPARVHRARAEAAPARAGSATGPLRDRHGGATVAVGVLGVRRRAAHPVQSRTRLPRAAQA